MVRSCAASPRRRPAGWSPSASSRAAPRQVMATSRVARRSRASKACFRSTASSRSRTARRPSVLSTVAPSSGTAASSCSSARAYLGELSRINPAMLSACERAVRDGKEDLTFFRLCADSFGKAPELSIDHAVMEHTTRAAVVPVDMAWSDVGSWPALHGVGQADGDGNVLQGDVLTENVHNSYIRSEGPLVATVGLDTCDRGRDRRRRARRRTPTLRRSHWASWRDCAGGIGRSRQRRHLPSALGHYSTVDIGERFQVKRITVNPERSWACRSTITARSTRAVVRGTAIVQRDEERMLVRERSATSRSASTIGWRIRQAAIAAHRGAIGAYLGEETSFAYPTATGGPGGPVTMVLRSEQAPLPACTTRSPLHDHG